MDTVIQLLESQAQHYKDMQSAKFEEGKDLSSLFIVLEQEFREAIKILNEAIVKRENEHVCTPYKTKSRGVFEQSVCKCGKLL